MKNNEAKTLLRKGVVAGKGDLAIELRGALDGLYAKCVYACSVLREKDGELFEKLAEITRVVSGLIRCEALCESMEFCGVFGYSCEELRTVSHNPKKYFGIDSVFFADENASQTMALLNCLRTDVRACERTAVRALEDGQMPEILQCLNRLSSAMFILMMLLHKKEQGQ